MSSRKERLALIQKQAQEKFGKSHMQRASDRPVDIPLLPIGGLQFDMMIGGGFPVGALSLLWGWEGGGKTTTALKAIASCHKMCSDCNTFIQPVLLVAPAGASDEEVAEWRSRRQECVHCKEPYHLKDKQRTKARTYSKAAGASKEDLKEIDKGAYICTACGCIGSEEEMFRDLEEDEEFDRFEYDGGYSCECGNNTPTMALFVDFENRLDLRWAQTLGVDLDRLIIESPLYGEQGIDIIKRAVAEGVVDIIVIDSVANISTAEEVDVSSSGSKSFAGSARLVNQFLRGLPGLLVRARDEWGVRTTVLALNQVRNKVGAFGGHTLFGGEGQKFASSTTVKFTGGASITDEEQVGAKARKETLGVSSVTIINAQCDKSSVRSARGLNCQFRLVTATDGELRKGDIDDYSLIIQQGKACGVIRKCDEGYRVSHWPVTFRILDDIKAELRRNIFFKFHANREIIRAVHDQDWFKLKSEVRANK